MTSAISSQDPSLLSAFFYGGSLQVTLLTLTHPFDRIKTLRQAQLKHGALFDIFREVIKKNGYRNLYSGFQYNSMNGFFKGASRWVILSSFERVYKKMSQKDSPLLKTSLLVFSISLIETPWICATEILKTREMTKNSINYRIREMLKNEGLTLLTKGARPVFLKQVVSWGSFLGPIEFLSTWAEKRADDQKLSSMNKLAISAIGSFINIVLTNPVDVIKTKAQQYNSPYPDQSICNYVRSIFSNEGMRGFTKGMSLRFFSSQIHSTASIYIMMMLGFYRKES